MDSIINNNPPVSNCDEDFIFISYSHKDKEIVYNDLWTLTENGISIWYDNGITAGEIWNETVLKIIENPNCKFVIFFVSKNTIISPAIKKEMQIIKERGLSFFTINIEETGIQQLIVNAIGAGQIALEDVPLYTSFLGKDILSINRHDKNYLDNVVVQCINHGIKANIKVVNIKNITKKVLIICKNSSFSNSIINGVYEFFSTKENIVVDKKLIDKNKDRVECASEFSRILKENMDKYDGFILRVPEKYNDLLLGYIHNIIKIGKKVVLLDIELASEKFNDEKITPSYVGSDFVSGGVLLGDRIGKLVQRFGPNNTNVILFEGPYANSSAKIRCDNLYKKLISTVPTASIARYNLTSLTVSTAIECIKEKANEWRQNRTLLGKTVILFCGIDNIAVEIMRMLARNEDYNPINTVLREATKVIIVGYDGIRDANNELVLKNYGVDFLTIDVVPFKQGVNAGEKMYSLLFDRKDNSKILTQPELIEYIKFGSEKFTKVSDINFLLDNKKLLIFDLDGTIADTETLHWEAYNVLLAKYGIRLSNDDIKKYIGNSEMCIYKMIKRDFGIEFDEDDFLAKRIEIYLELVEKRGLKPFPFIDEILKSTNCQKALVTSQIPMVVNKLLKLWCLDKYFPENTRFCCHDGTYVKKNVYKNIGTYLGFGSQIKPGEILLFEDSPHYIVEAKKLGLAVVGIEHKYNKNTIKNCDAIISTSLHRGAFIGLCGLDVIYYGTSGMPKEDSKISIRDFSFEVGGPAANAAITYAKLGGEAYLITRIGDSAEGRLLKSKLKDLDVTVFDIDQNNKNSKCNASFVYINQIKGSRTIFSGQASATSSCDMDFADLIKKADFVLYDGNLPIIEEKMIQNVDYFDKDLIIDAGSYKAGLPECCYHAKTVISSENYVDPNVGDVFELQKKYGFCNAAKTRGGHSILYNNTENEGEIVVPNVEVIDTLGAGDIIHGAFCYFYYAKSLSFEQALEFAARVASHSVTQKGVVNGLKYAINNI